MTTSTLFLGFNLLAGCLASAPKKTSSSSDWSSTAAAFGNLRSSKSGSSINSIANPFAFAGNNQSEVNCHDRAGSGSYSEDTSPECVRAQTLRAYRALNLQMDPEVPYCILRQESSSVKDNSDPYEVEFNRLAVCRKNGKYCGIGLAQFTFGTWSGYDKILRNNPEKQLMLTNCLNTLSSATTQPKQYSNVSIQQISPSMTESILNTAKTKIPGEALSPFYRDHAICMNALHLSEMPAAKQKSVGRYAIVGHGKNRRKVYPPSNHAQTQRLGAIYNGGGTAGYGSAIGRCVAAFRQYDNKHQASVDSFYLAPDSRQIRALATNDRGEGFGVGVDQNL